MFEETVAHEIGHEFTKYGGGSIYSKTHKDTSTILQKAKKERLIRKLAKLI